MTPRRPTQRVRSQSGVTLVEVLVASVIGILIGVPMLSWLNTTIKSTATVTDQLGRSNETGLLNAYLPRDVAGARSVTSTGQLSTLEDCGLGPGQDGRVVLVLISAGSDPQRIVYSEAPSSATGSARSLWRRTCDPTDPGAPVQGTELFRNVTPNSTLAACPGLAGSTCGLGATQVALSTTPVVTGQAVVVRGTRRADDASGGSEDPTRPGSRPPIAKAVVTPFKGYRNTVFTVDARSSIDQTAADPLTFTWTDPPGAVCTPVDGDPAVRTCTFASVGVAAVGLTATDGSTSGSATVNVEVLNRSPQAAVPQVTPASVPIGGTIILTDPDSTDPDGDPLTRTWDLGDGFTPVTGQTAQVVVPEGVEPGERQVRLTVTDDQGGSDTVFASVSITSASEPPDGPLLTVSPPPVLVVGNLRPLLGGVGVGRTIQATFGLRADAPADVTGVALFRAGEPTPLNNCPGTGSSCSLEFLGGDYGDFDLVAYAAGPDPAPVERERYRFRVGRVPTADINVTATGGTVPKTVTFTSVDSTDPDGIIVSRRWDFGCGNPTCTSTDVAPLYTFDTPGIYTVTLTVTDNDGLVSETTEVVEVAAP